MIKIEITPKMKMKARQYEKETLNSPTVKRLQNYTGYSAPDRYYKGYLGEFVFLKILYDNKKKYEYQPRTDGVADDGDFKIWIKGKKIDIDTKFFFYNGSKELLVGESQYIKRPHSYYVSGNVIGDTAYCYGYCTYDEIGKANKVCYRIPSYSIEFKDLHPIEDLLLQIDINQPKLI